MVTVDFISLCSIGLISALICERIEWSINLHKPSFKITLNNALNSGSVIAAEILLKVAVPSTICRKVAELVTGGILEELVTIILAKISEIFGNFSLLKSYMKFHP